MKQKTTVLSERIVWYCESSVAAQLYYSRIPYDCLNTNERITLRVTAQIVNKHKTKIKIHTKLARIIKITKMNTATSFQHLYITSPGIGYHGTSEKTKRQKGK